MHHARGDDAADHDEERHGAVLQEGLAEQEEQQGDQTQRQGRRVGVAQAREEVAHALPEIAVCLPLKPNSFGSCVLARNSATPHLKPMSTVSEKKLTMAPARTA